MKYIDRKGNLTIEDSSQDKLLRVLYTHAAGRILLRPLVTPLVSKIGGAILNTRLSTRLIPGFVRRNQIDLHMYQPKDYISYNDFFTRKIKPQYRPIEMNEQVLISPSDGKISVYPIHDDCSLSIKNTTYTVPQLVGNSQLAQRFSGGYAFVIRLTVDDYHRYCYPANGVKSGQYQIPGVFHTVNPIANDTFPIYKMNTREFCLIQTQNMKTLLVMEVGALFVGKIHNNKKPASPVTKGMEKGRFEFGGSTIVLFVQKDAVIVDADLISNTQNGYETFIKYGEQVAVSRSDSHNA